MTATLDKINQHIEKHSQFVPRLFEDMGKVIVGQTAVLERLVIALLSGGHVLLEGVPGLAKTLSVETLAKSIQAEYKRIQFTPDLLPSDLVGSLIYEQSKGDFVPKLGPIFANFVLADEINRAPAKVQSALLEAMQEAQVTLGEKSYPLPKPFMVLATQNPLEQEGTYPLPEAQLDRFLMKVIIDYPSRDEEKTIMERMTGNALPALSPTVTLDAIVAAKQALVHIYVDDKVKNYILDLVAATRNPNDAGLGQLAPLIEAGASPRASLALLEAARAHAFIRGRGFVIPEDIKAIAKDVLRHRLVLSFEAEAEEKSADDIIDTILAAVDVP